MKSLHKTKLPAAGFQPGVIRLLLRKLLPSIRCASGFRRANASFSHIVVLNAFFMLWGCDAPLETPKECVKGKYIGTYCEGLVIQLSGSNSLGKTWESIQSKDTYQNCVVASLDTAFFKNPSLVQSVLQDSIFYFQYRMGGYARKQFNLCEPSPFITITALSNQPCKTNDSK